METRIGPFLSIKVLQVFSVGWQGLSLAFITILLPQALLPVGIIASLVALFLATAAVLKARSTWVWLSMFDALIIFLMLLIYQAMSGTIGGYIPITLLQFVMILFAVELLTTSCSSGQRPSTDLPALIQPELEDSHGTWVKQAFRHISMSGMLFAGCYMLSLGTLFLGELTASAAPLLAEISLYIVVVSISLALLLVSKEDHGQS